MTITVQENQYIYPPRPEGAVPRWDTQIFEDLGWIAQIKYNDTRILIKLRTDGRIELWNRHAEKLRTYTPHIHLQEQLQTLRQQLPGYCLLDGGLIHQKHQAIKHTIAIWDILVLDGQHLIGTTYQHRNNIIQTLTTNTNYTHNNFPLGKQITPDIITPQNLTPEQWPQTWQLIDNINQQYQQPLLEGLVFKDPQGILQHGYKEKNNTNWSTRSRVETGRHRF